MPLPASPQVGKTTSFRGWLVSPLVSDKDVGNYTPISYLGGGYYKK